MASRNRALVGSTSEGLRATANSLGFDERRCRKKYRRKPVSARRRAARWIWAGVLGSDMLKCDLDHVVTRWRLR